MPTAAPLPVPEAVLAEFCQTYGVAELSLFGSILRKDFGPESDVDVMLAFRPGYGFTFENTPDIEDALRRIFGRPVDVIEKGRIKNPIRHRGIMSSYRVLYAA